MEFTLSRYRNVTVLVLVLAAQLFLLAYQIKSRQDVRSIRVWAVTGVMPLTRLLDFLHDNTVGLIKGYSGLMEVKDKNKDLQAEVAKLKMENNFLRTELATADRAKVLALFPSRLPSKSIAAHVTGRGSDSSKVVFVDRGSNDGVSKNLPVVTPDGVVGRITGVYPDYSQVVLITDINFAAGVISQKHRVHGTLKGQGNSVCTVDYIRNEEKVEVGEWLFTSGDDRIFPKGLPLGQVKLARAGKMFFQEVQLVPSGLQLGLEEVLILLEGVHQPIPDHAPPSASAKLLPPPPAEGSDGPDSARVIRGGVATTDADQVLDRYRRIGAAQGHAYGSGGGTPNFAIDPPPPRPPAAPPAPETPPQ